MRRERWFGCLAGVLLAFAIGCGGIGCMVTAMSMQMHAGWMVLWCSICAAAWGLMHMGKKPWVGWICFALLAGVLWLEGTLEQATYAFLHQISHVYGQSLGWPVFVAPMQAPETVDVTAAVGIFSVLSGFFVCRTVIGRKSALWAVAVSLVPLGLCLLSKQTVPESGWLFVLLAGLGLLMITQTLGRKHIVQGNRLRAMAVIPVLLLTAMLFWLFPKDSYDQQDLGKRLASNVTGFLQDVLGQTGRPVSADGGAVDLQKVGKRQESNERVMTVTAPADGVLYLRGCAYDTYYRNTWTNLAVECQLPWPSADILTYQGDVTVKTDKALNMVVVPYYAADAVPADMTRGVGNYIKKTAYSYPQYTLPAGYSQLEQGQAPSTDALTQLPTVTYAWARSVLQEILSDEQDVYGKAQAISQYVKNSAKYSLSPKKMPEEAQDFAQWFIEESDEGYCVHFATAATVLLRAAGIPARYVTGYVVNASAGNETEVYGKNAHAWTEYYLPGVGWVILEPTPASGFQQQIKVKGETGRNILSVLKTLAIYTALLLPPVLAVGILVQWRVRVWLRRRKIAKGTLNARALALWQQLAQVYRLLEKTADPSLYVLAEKAKFSASGVTGQELEQMQNALQDALRQLKCHNLRHRMKYTFLLAIY